MDRPGKNSRAPRVLIVDDDPVLRLLAREALEVIGLDVEETSDGIEALLSIEREVPDLILLDVDMPRMDGFETCESLRRYPWATEIPVLIATGLTDFEAVERAFEVGATDFITKPFSPPLLQQRVRFLMRASAAFTELRTSQQRLANSQRLAQIGSWDWDLATNEFSFSDEFFRVVGRPAESGTLGYEAFLSTFHPDDQREFEEILLAAKEEGKSFLLDNRVITESGAVGSVHVQAEVPPASPKEAGVVRGTIQDITRRKRAEEEIRCLANFDILTGLPNRRMLSEHLGRTLERALRANRTVALLFLDLDQFKRVNDTLGHEIGDELLKQVADRLVGCVRTSDLVYRGSNADDSAAVARLGGDEFTVVLSRIGESSDAARVASRILKDLSAPFSVSDHNIVVGASIGISVFPSDGDSAPELLRSADVAMYHAKDEGRNNFQFYRESMNARVAKNLRIEGMLREALDEDQLVLHYQPRIETATGAINGVEALVRIVHPEAGVVPPLDFIPVAEDTGLIVPLGLWVLRTACSQSKAWQTLGMKPISVAVNVSTQQIRRPGLVEAVETVLRETGLEPKYLELEITESVFLEDERRTRQTLDRLREMGILLAVDDFGTGYSSMSYLKRFPIGMLKIDRAFVKDVAQNPENRGIVGAIIAMSREFGLTVVAEGVETEEEEDFLRTRECDALQGYRFGRPMEPEDILVLLTREAEEETKSS